MNKNLKTVYTSIVGIGDPFILADKKSKKYYMYATSSSEGFLVWQSEDLLSWEQKGLCFDKKTSNTFGYTNFWAPEVIYNPKTDKFVMHYTARLKTDFCEEGHDSGVLKIGVAISDSPLGPFIDPTGKPMFDLGKSVATIDASCLIDVDNAYLYYSKDCSTNIVEGVHTSQIYAVKLNDTLTECVGEHYLISTPDKPWEWIDGHKSRWNEGPFVIKNQDKYYLNYSANCYADKEYCIGVAVSNTPLGGFVKKEAPTVKYIQGKTSGPGHNMLFYDLQGNLWCVYHIHTDLQKRGGDRKVLLSPAKFVDGELIVDYK